MAIPLVHVTSYATDLGIARIGAAAILSAVGVTGVVGRIGFGLLADGIGGRLALVLTSLAQTAGAAGFLLAADVPGLMAAALLFGLGYGGILPQYPLICREVYGGENLGRIIGSVSLFGTLGMAAGGYLGGMLFDVSGSYTVPFLVSVLFGALNLTLAVALVLGQRRLAPVGASPLGWPPACGPARPARKVRRSDRCGSVPSSWWWTTMRTSSSWSGTSWPAGRSTP
ncbi:MAG: MFS transporter [candidate division NC10 bacterium]|nr:MFS transporter [candidate division NC10 bacterium]